MSNKRTILLVDDDINLIDMLGDFLEGEGYEIVKASSGEQALADLRTISPDLIVLDMMMPGIGGMGVLNHLLLPDGTFKYPILVLTAKAVMSEYFADKQVDGFLAKPCDPKDLALEVSRIIFQSADKIPSASTPLLYIADPSAARRKTLANALEKDGFSVTQITSGAELLQETVLSPPNIIVMALELPDQNAAIVVNLLKAMSATSQVEIVVYGIGLPNAQLDHVLALDSRKCLAVSADGEVDVCAAVATVALRMKS